MNWIGHLHLGRWITDNTALLTEILTLVVVLVQYQLNRMRQKEATIDRKRIEDKVEENTQITSTVLAAQAMQQGVPVDELISSTRGRLDEVMRSHLRRARDVAQQERGSDLSNGGEAG